jgi:hypothetical protein
VTEARRTQQIAAHFLDLQGLRQVPFGIAALCLFGVEMILNLSREGIKATPVSTLLWMLAFLVAAFAVAFLALARISAWYRCHFGTVEQTRNQRRAGRLIAVLGSLAFTVPLFAIEEPSWTVYRQALPVNLAVVTVSLGIVGLWLYLGRFLNHYLVLAGLGLVLGVASVAGLPPPTWPWHLREATLYVGVAAIVAGILDHRALVSVLSPPEN